MNDVLVVVGAGGVGASIARRVGAGRLILLGDIDAKLLTSTGEALAAEGFQVETVVVDVADSESMEALAQLAASLGPVRAVAHTAGVSAAQATTEQILRIDLLGVAHSLDSFHDIIAPGGAGVYLASMAGTFAQGGLSPKQEEQLAFTPTNQLLELPFLDPSSFVDSNVAYMWSKRANQLRVQSASLSWGTKGARVNSISPGVISTPMGRSELTGDSAQVVQTMINRSPSGRIGTPMDIADAAAFLLGPTSSFVTGTDLLVDGGAVAGARQRPPV